MLIQFELLNFMFTFYAFISNTFKILNFIFYQYDLLFDLLLLLLGSLLIFLLCKVLLCFSFCLLLRMSFIVYNYMFGLILKEKGVFWHNKDVINYLWFDWVFEIVFKWQYLVILFLFFKCQIMKNYFLWEILHFHLMFLRYLLAISFYLFLRIIF